MNIKILLYIIFFFAATCMVLAQAKAFKVNAQTFVTQTKKIDNEWNTKDEIKPQYVQLITPIRTRVAIAIISSGLKNG
ncbi:hypothetical protein U0035_05505 [Niabella yanshanensis]|uniref:Uncharacterized protein n=1 Tax=Niabella yanshanensis TaxID=577386 RepID=A0ABZ0WCL0_9BACT|nr:hypothetical protein [Niabella yanshanensis]WQD39602.1 hypothetical protein U0035_05505 [Niabella yanshanensis]